MDIELARMVAEDLDYLTKDWNQDIDDASLRRSSPVLRSLLSDGMLAKIARAANKDIRIMAPILSKALTEEELNKTIFFQAGGAKYNGTEIQSFSINQGAKTLEEHKAAYDREKNVIGKSQPIKLGLFLQQTSFIIEGIFINRDEVIKYVANKLGGTHYDPARKAGNALEEKYALLDTVRTKYKLADKNTIYYELLSIGQIVVNSRDIQTLRKHLKSVTGG